MTDLNVKIGGAAGQGIQNAGFLLGKALVRSGYHVFAIQDAMSRIRGGHNFFQLRVSGERVAAMTGEVDLLVALDQGTIDLHRGELSPSGLVILDSETLKTPADGHQMIDLPMKRLAIEHGGKPIYATSVALGFILGLIGSDLETLNGLFRESFIKDDLAERNTAAARAGFERVQPDLAGRFGRSFAPTAGPRRMFLTANEAIALGAIASGLKFMSAYPMSPSTSIITYLAGKEDQVGLVTEQAEDEIAAINLAFGASMAGVRAMTATSGGGLALMSETISLLGVAEVPLVIVNCQRPGPATGMPTRTEQADLLLAIHAGHGEFPRAVLAPGSAEQAFRCTIRAFNLADRFQIPVILMADQYLSDSYYTVEPFDVNRVTYETSLLRDEDLAALDVYNRYQISKDGVSPRAYPGQSEHLVLTDSHEHDESGHITEDADVRNRMVRKRLSKIADLRASFRGPDLFGPADAEVMLIGWGSTREVLCETVTALRDQGMNVGLLHYSELWPFPEEGTIRATAHDPRLITVEGNATGQLAQLIRQHTGDMKIDTLSRHDGRPFLVDELIPQLGEMVRS